MSGVLITGDPGETGPGRRSLSRARSSTGNRRHRGPSHGHRKWPPPSLGDTSSDTSPVGRVSCARVRVPRHPRTMVEGPCDGIAGSPWDRRWHSLNRSG